MLISEIREINKSLKDQDLLEMQSGGKSFRVSFVKFYDWIKQKLNLADVAYTGKFQDLKEIPPLPTKGYIDSRDQQTYNQAKGYTDGVASAKVDKEEGKGLSSNDYTDFDKNKMDSIQYGATRLSPATSSILGGIKVGDNLVVLPDGTLSARVDAQVNADWLATEGVAEILNKPDLTVLATYEYVDEQVDEAITESKEYADTIVGDIDYSEFATKEGVEQGLFLKVDKEEGKHLSTEDYTTAEKNKLLGVESGAQVNPVPVDNLLSDDVSYPLSARQGKVLKGFIDTINDILTSDDTNLDELQEIVDFIKLNREDLDSLTISSIAGLEDALSNKQPLSSILTDTSASFTTILLSKLNNIEANAQVNTVNSVAGKTGAVVVTKSDVGLNNVDNTSDINKPISVPVQTALSDKVDKEVGKQLSTEDFTTGEKAKLSGIAVGATQNASDASLRDRATHTGVQPISSVEGLQTSLNTKASVQALQDLDDSLATVAKSGDYESLVNKPTIPEAQVNSNWNSTSGVSQILNKPTLGTAASQNVGAFATASQGVLADTAVQPSDLTPYALTEDVPQNTDELPEGGINKFVTQAEKDKIAGLEGSHYRGLYVSLVELAEQVETPLAGDYADVDEGVGSDVLRYIWDESDNQWVPQAGESAPITASQVKNLYESNPNTNAFTDAQDVKLSGIQTGATANATNAELRNRATHTGTQAISTITGLQTELDSKAVPSDIPDVSGLATKAEVTSLEDSLAEVATSGSFGDLSGVPSLVRAVVAGDNITVDNTDPENPVISSTGGDFIPSESTEGARFDWGLAEFLETPTPIPGLEATYEVAPGILLNTAYTPFGIKFGDIVGEGRTFEITPDGFNMLWGVDEETSSAGFDGSGRYYNYYSNETNYGSMKLGDGAALIIESGSYITGEEFYTELSEFGLYNFNTRGVFTVSGNAHLRYSSDFVSVVFDNDQDIVNKKYVDNAVAQGGAEDTYTVITEPTTAQVNKSYWVGADISLTLPPSAVSSVGDKVVVSKGLAYTASVLAPNGSQIITTKGSTAEVLFDMNAEITFVYNGTNWEI